MSYYLNPTTGQWPLTTGDIKAENPDTSYPKGCTAFDGYIAIPDPAEPAYDPMTQRLVLLPPGKWDIEQGLRMITTKDPITGVETTEEKLVDISSTWVPSEDGKYSQTYRVDPMSEQDIADNITNKTAQEAVRVRQTRGEKLEACDWHGLSDNVMTAEMTTYRQALRDVPQQDEFPNEINWPVEPN